MVSIGRTTADKLLDHQPPPLILTISFLFLSPLLAIAGLIVWGAMDQTSLALLP